MSDMKQCARCQLNRPASDFTPDPRMRSGLKSYCRECCRMDARERYAANPEHIREVARKAASRRRTPERTRAQHLRNMYGLDVATYDAMLVAQGGRCAICRREAPGGRGNWHVDHCHDTGKVRGLLCAYCNPGIGYLGHDPACLRAAATYIEKHQEKS